MRLHTLHLQAFGPFADRHTVDFDALSTDGLFLLHGDTGAGKSTLFAAICFALYGKPPGDRNLLLRSDHAAADLLTQVTLEVTLAGKRLRIIRTPAQQRPKKSGDGTTPQKAETLLSEYVGNHQGSGRWEASTRSHQETAAEIIELLGMSREQFCQIVLLPQNEFTQFLRAGASDRKALLGKLFHTHRFTAIEEWLTRRKNGVERTRDEARSQVLRLAERIQQAASDELDPAQGAPTAEDHTTLTDHARTWATALHTAAQVHQQQTTQTLTASELELAAFKDKELAVRDLATRQDAHHTAEQQLAQLQEQKDQQEQLQQQRERALRAQKLAPALHAADTAHSQHTRAQEDEDTARTLLAPEHSNLDAVQLTDAGRRLRADIGALRALLPDEATIRQLTGELAKLDEERILKAEDLNDANAWLEQAPQQRAELTTRLEQARQAETDDRDLVATLITLATRLDAAHRRDTSLRQVTDAEKKLDTAKATTQEAARTHIDIRRRRTDGMAAELATQLSDGEACPVCGSPTHPAPAAPHPDQPTAADEQAAERHHAQAQQTQEDLQDTLQKLLTQAATARGEAGGDAPTSDLKNEHDALTQRRKETLERAADAGPASEQLDALDREQAEKTRIRDEASTYLAGANANYDRLDTQRQELDQRLATARADAPTLTDRITELTHTVDHIDAAAEKAATTLRTAQEQQHTADTATHAARAAGFDSLPAAQDALLPDEELTALEDAINQWREQRAALTARLAEPELQAAAAEPPADLDTATEEHQAATTRHTRAATTADQAASRTTTLADLITQLDAHIQRLEPLEDDYQTVHHLHGLINGMSPSNKLRMQLEAYVLAARLEQVVEAANTRLVRMSDHRYTLAHSDARAARGARSGLGLKVTDAWTGRARDTDTLSGGESFFASLSLALGLADVVTAESGGQALDTLFIDEGFGTLDEDTLHHVLDVLDSLRAHNRTVGVISHVPELRRRITHRLHVRKDTTGSTLTQLIQAAE
ncbi:SMC family ATPase [Streptomyces decoyicus]|uniref:SMC family ATPase n=1 Tax=Streptomyces decoyicus TaxID=249567 RepID=UPI0033B58465